MITYNIFKYSITIKINTNGFLSYLSTKVRCSLHQHTGLAPIQKNIYSIFFIDMYR